MQRFKESAGIALENDIHHWWADSGFKIAQGIGLFSHLPLEKDGHDIRLVMALKHVRKLINAMKSS